VTLTSVSCKQPKTKENQRPEAVPWYNKCKENQRFERKTLHLQEA